MEKVKYERIPLDRFTRSDESNLGTLRFATGSKESSEVPGKKKQNESCGILLLRRSFANVWDIYIYIYELYDVLISTYIFT